MNAPYRPAYTEFHPRWHRKKVTTFWWLGSWPYTRFILRELTSIAVAMATLETIGIVCALGSGPAAWDAFREFLKEPAVVFLNGMMLIGVLYHSITWFNLAPSAMVVKVAGERVPVWMIAAGNYAGWIGASIVVGWAVLRG